MPQIRAYGSMSGTSPLAQLTIPRRDVGPTDVKIDILFCGVCHSDLHTARGEWGGVQFPAVPGHEIVGKVVAVGAEVTKFAVGQNVGVGCMVDSCRECESCKSGREQYCYEGNIGTYNGKDHHLGGHTFGGYATDIVVDQDFVLSIADSLPLDAAAPLLCAGITLYSPLRHWGAGPGKKVGIVGLGGLGHMGVKIARAMGAHVVMLTTSPSKAKDAEKLGAHEVLIWSDEAAMRAASKTFDLLMNTVPQSHDINALTRLLKVDGAHVLLGVPPTPYPPLDVGRMIGNRLTVAASTIGGIAETQEMLDFCAQHGIVSDIEMIAMQDINEAYDRMSRNDVKYRFVIDMASLKNVAA
ncbi:MAG: hydroxyacid dehydrogenase [Devosia sp.]|nr:hydroxyacid dehydrogenase [Devosia sp.]